MLSESVMNLMAVKAAETMLKEGSVRGIDRPGLIRLIMRAFNDEMNVERAIIAEAEKLLEAHLGQSRDRRLDVGELRSRIIQKLARERGVVLR